MTNLLMFVLGILFIQFIIPLMDGILSLILAWLERLKAKQAEIINLTNLRIEQAAASSDNVPSVLGFGACLNNKEEEEDDDDL